MMNRITYYTAILLLLPAAAMAQATGTVMDAEDHPLDNVLVVTKRTHHYTYTNVRGYFKLKVDNTDTLLFMTTYYRTVQKSVLELQDNNIVHMKRLEYSMEEVEIKPEMERYLQEHKELLETYESTFRDAERKPHVIGSAGTAAGFTIDGLFTELASRISGQKKRDKHFKEEFDRMERDKFIAIRYNPEVVMSATHTSRDTAINFIRDTPMAMDFAREASSLELMMWIRDHFKQWEHKQIDKAHSPLRTD